MNSKKKYSFCCWRFEESVEDEIFEHAEDYDETEWFMPGACHIYYCPYCGTNIKGEGFGEPPKKGDKRSTQE